MRPLDDRPFLKMNGIGNEIIVLDLRGYGARVTPDDARAIHRAPRLAYDQLMILHDPRTPGTDAYVAILNNDGSEAGACGNGTRCVAWALMRDGARDHVRLETRAGLLEARRAGETRFTVDMGAPRFGWADIPLAHAVPDTRAVSLPVDPPGAEPALEALGVEALGPCAVVDMGNPHAVFFVDDAMAVDLARVGPVLERHPLFPERANISVAQVRGEGDILLRVWERGAGITRACGSAACATLVAAARTGRAGRAATIELPGGRLDIAWRASDDHVLMTGDVELEFEGRFDPAVFAGAGAGA